MGKGKGREGGEEERGEERRAESSPSHGRF
jgi:hypothetical protein